MKNGWTKQKLGEIISLEYGKPLPNDRRDENGIYPAYGANGVKCRTNDSFWDTPSIIIGRKGSAGELNLVDAGFWPLDVTYYVTFDHEKCDLKFFYYMLSRLNLPSLAKGVKPGINRNDVYAIEQFIPPLPEQKHIVAILDEAFAGIATAVANTEKNLANTRELFESYLNSVFSQRGEGWEETRLSDCAISVSTGPFGSLLHKSDYVYDGVPLVNPVNIVGSEIVPDENKLISDKTKERLQAYILRKGDIVIARRGEIGRCTVINEEQDGWVCGTGCFFIRPRPVVNSYFLASMIRSDIYRTELERQSTGATMKNISNKALSNLIIVLPNKAEQEIVVKKLVELSEQSHSLESIYQRKLTALTELKQSLLQKAFSGELTAEAEPIMEEVVA